MTLHHAELVDLLQQAYSAEKAAAFAYQGHAGSLRHQHEKLEVRQIEEDEWNHRREVSEIMMKYGIPVSRFYELRFHVIGKIISWSCYVIGRFMPFYFAGRLESGNVCEYFRMKEFFNSLGIYDHDNVLLEMGIKEKEHEMYFAEKVQTDPLLPFFEKLFGWSSRNSMNNVDLSATTKPEHQDLECKTRPNFFTNVFQYFVRTLKV